MERDEPRRDEPAADPAAHDRWREAEELFHRALEVPPEHRDTWLREATADESVRGEVADLLAHHREDEELTGLDGLGGAPTGALPGSPAPDAIGPYRIVGELGQGGMGVVYEAERMDLGKRVALKLARESVFSPERRLRFQLEQRVLARLQHPNIAQLHDAGVTDDGTPWFAMEIVEGESIVRHARDAKLPTRQRLELFLDVCAAVHDAHRSLVVHRDIKPSNVLVTTDGRVKLLDFGVAKLIETTDDPELTRTQSRIYTPGYAAPEQIRGDTVTTATDVYQLGALLYELLAGVPAFDVADLSLHEAERLVLETDPPAPSRAATKRSGGAGGDAVPRDLDSIALAAVQKDPEDRYASAEALAADVRRYLDGLPVSARPNTAAYRLRRFVRRHRAGVAAAAGFAILLAGSVVALALQQSATARQRDLARAAAEQASLEATKAEQVTAFLFGLFEASDPSVAQGDTLTARELLDRGMARADAFADHPDVHAILLGTTGRIQLNLGDVDEAEGLLRRSLAVWGDVEDPDPAAVAETNLGLARSLELQGRHEESSDIYRKLAASSPEADTGTRSRAMYGLFTALHALERAEGADSAFRAWESLVVDQPGRPDAAHSRALVELGQVMHYRGDVEKAEVLLRQGVAGYRALYGDRHPDLGNALNALAGLLASGPPTPAADSVTLEAVSLHRRLYPGGHPALSLALGQRADVLRYRGDLAGAEALLREALNMEVQHPGREGMGYTSRNHSLAGLLMARGALEESERRLRENVAWWRRNFGADHPFALTAEVELSTVLRERGAYDEAEEMLLSAYEQLRAARGDDDPYARTTRRLLQRLYEAWDRPADAARYASSGS